jgi:hypothetical protein
MSDNEHLDRAAILGKTAMPTQDIAIPEWDGTVTIRAMTAGERDRWEGYVRTYRDVDIRARLAIGCVCDQDGNLLFTEADLPAMSALNGKALDRIFEAAVMLSKIGRDDLDELKKNSKEAEPVASSSSSPDTSKGPLAS